MDLVHAYIAQKNPCTTANVCHTLDNIYGHMLHFRTSFYARARFYILALSCRHLVSEQANGVVML